MVHRHFTAKLVDHGTSDIQSLWLNDPGFNYVHGWAAGTMAGEHPVPFRPIAFGCKIETYCAALRNLWPPPNLNDRTLCP